MLELLKPGENLCRAAPGCRRSEPLKPRDPARLAELQQPVKSPRQAARQLPRQQLRGRGVRPIPGGGDHPHQRVDRRTRHLGGEQMLA
jgi:hypothetical protein